MSDDRDSLERVDADLRRVADAADALVRTAQELRASLDSLSESVRDTARENADKGSAPRQGRAEEIPDGARIVALDMVLDGRSRDEVAARLDEEFGLSDSDSLLDDVYARVG